MADSVLDNSLRLLNANMQELVALQFREVNARLENISRGQEAMTESVAALLARPITVAVVSEEVTMDKVTSDSFDGTGGEVAFDTQETTNTKRQSVNEIQLTGSLCKMVSETLEKTFTQESVPQDKSPLRFYARFWALDTQGKESAIDAFMGVLIVINSLTIGFSMDNEGFFWTALDVFFSVAFVLELISKISLLGCRVQYCGPARAFNIFDASLIFVDLLQLIMQNFLKDAAGSMEATPSASMFRIVRLVRLVRLLRVLRMPIFSDLIAMITGMMGGMGTLLWAIALFLMIIYVVSLLFREFFGRQELEGITELFDSVPRAMFTVFRCAFGDCSAAGGIPIFEHIVPLYGPGSALLYCLFTFVVCIGLFNVISAIFVESTMKAAMASEEQKRHARLKNTDLWNTKVSLLVMCFMELSGKQVKDKARLSENVQQSILTDEIHPDMFKAWIEDERVIGALNELDINSDDHPYLFDILDADNSQVMFVTEVIDGIARLRGEPRRSDTITIDLMVRSIQTQCNALVEGMEKLMVHNKL